MIVCGAVLAAAAMVAGCDPGQKVTNESTPPALTWSVLNKDTRVIQTVVGGGIVTAAPGDSFSITLKANDNGGVQHMTLGGEAGWSCTSDDGSLGQNKDALFGSQDQTFPPRSDGTVEHYTFLLTTSDPSSWDCQSGFHYSGGAASYTGTATNYSGKQAQGSLTIKRSS